MKSMLKRFAMLSLVLTMVVTTCLGGVVSANSVLFDLKSLGVTEGFDFEQNLDANVTRGEFAQLVVNLMCQSEAASAIASEAIFADSLTNPYNGAINLLYKQGVVAGAGNGMYLPNNFVGYGEACKILVKILGYTPAVSDQSDLNSYALEAGKIGVTKGVTASGNLTAKQVLTMLYNCLDIDRMVPVYYGANLPVNYEIDEGNTFRSSIAEAKPSGGLVKLRGIVTADVTTYLDTQKAGMRDNQIEVDGKIFTYSGVAPTGLVGMEVDMFATTFEDGEYDKITAITVTDKNTVTNVIGEDIKTFTRTSLKYTTDESGKKSEELTLNSATKYIYNNNIDRSFSPSSVNCDTKTHIRAIDNDGDEIVDVVFVFVYEDRIVDSVSAERTLVTLDSALNGAVNIELDPDDTDKRVEYFNADGTASSFSAIEPDDCISFAVSKDGYSVRIVISKEKVNGRVESKDGDYITVNGVEYRSVVSTSSYGVGDNVTLWLNYRNEVAKIDERSYYEDGEVNLAYVYQTGRKGSGNLGTAQVKLLIPSSLSSDMTEVVDTDTGEITTTGKVTANNEDVLVYELAKKVRVDGVSRQSSDSATLNMINHRPIRYKLDSDGKINSIDFLDSLKDYVVDSITGEYATDSEGNYQVKTETVSKYLKYNSANKIFGAANCKPFGIDDTSVAVCVPTSGNSVASIDDESLTNYKYTVENSYKATVSAYEVDDDTHIAKFVIFEFAASAMDIYSMPTPKAEKKNVGMVKASGWALDENGDEVMSFTMLTQGNESAVKEQTLTVSPLISVPSSFNEIGKGDLVLYSLDDFGRINNIKLVKDFGDRANDRTLQESTNYETHCYKVQSIDFDEIDNANVRWMDKLVLCSASNPDVAVKTFNVPHVASILPIVFVLDSKGESKLGAVKDICYGDRVCVYRPSDFSNVAAIVIYR